MGFSLPGHKVKLSLVQLLLLRFNFFIGSVFACDSGRVFLDNRLGLCYSVPKAIALCSHCGQVALSLEHSVGFFYVIDTEIAAAFDLLSYPFVYGVDAIDALYEIHRFSVHVVPAMNCDNNRFPVSVDVINDYRNLLPCCERENRACKVFAQRIKDSSGNVVLSTGAFLEVILTKGKRDGFQAASGQLSRSYAKIERIALLKSLFVVIIELVFQRHFLCAPYRHFHIAVCGGVFFCALHILRSLYNTLGKYLLKLPVGILKAFHGLAHIFNGFGLVGFRGDILVSAKRVLDFVYPLFEKVEYLLSKALVLLTDFGDGLHHIAGGEDVLHGISHSFLVGRIVERLAAFVLGGIKSAPLLEDIVFKALPVLLVLLDEVVCQHLELAGRPFLDGMGQLVGESEGHSALSAVAGIQVKVDGAVALLVIAVGSFHLFAVLVNVHPLAVLLVRLKDIHIYAQRLVQHLGNLDACSLLAGELADINILDMGLAFDGRLILFLCFGLGLLLCYGFAGGLLTKSIGYSPLLIVEELAVLGIGKALLRVIVKPVGVCLAERVGKLCGAGLCLVIGGDQLVRRGGEAFCHLAHGLIDESLTVGGIGYVRCADGGAVRELELYLAVTDGSNAGDGHFLAGVLVDYPAVLGDIVIALNLTGLFLLLLVVPLAAEDLIHAHLHDHFFSTLGICNGLILSLRKLVRCGYSSGYSIKGLGICLHALRFKTALCLCSGIGLGEPLRLKSVESYSCLGLGRRFASIVLGCIEAFRIGLSALPELLFHAYSGVRSVG